MSWVSAILLLIFCVSEALAQVSFDVSPDGKRVSAGFSHKQLARSLERGQINPADILKIYVGIDKRAEIEGQPSVLGTYSTGSAQIIFRPLVPFSEALPYLVVFGDSLEHRFQIAVPADRAKTRLLQAYPTADTVPANLLKIYLEFSAPMREGEVYQRVSLYDPQGNGIENPFVPLQPELWDADSRMVTLWLDPGRVKRALLSRETHGPVLEAGKSYRLVVDPQWKDAHGQTLEAGISKTFHVVSDDRVKPEIKSWLLTAPTAKTQVPLMVRFGASMDYATALHAFSVTINGKAVSGSVLLYDSERVFKFHPQKPWITGIYQLIISSKLEDLAGNNLNRLFDRDLTDGAGSPSEQEFYSLDFEVL